jgi:pyruvate dehydrogenase E1 component
MPPPNRADRFVGTRPSQPLTDLSALDEIQRRVLWLATRMVDSANRDRDAQDGVKVGGHQASSASLVSVMTALWFVHLNREDRVSVKPHASPVFHAIQYLLGHLDRTQLTRLRGLGGLQAYPSRTKDPDRLYVDFSTGSVGHGAAAPLFAAVTRRYVDAHFGARPRSRFVALIGDAELDEGNIWEAIADPVTQGLGDVLWIIDFNRQSLDRVVPGVRARQWEQQFEAAGWHVCEVKYGQRLRAQFSQPHGDAFRQWIDRMSNEQYQSIFGLTGDELRARFVEGAPSQVRTALSGVDDHDVAPLLQDLGGHDLAALLDALQECDQVTDRPSVMFAYTIKGWGLPLAGNPRNHSALLTGEQIDRLRESVGLSPETEWDPFEPDTPAGILVARRAEHLTRSPRSPAIEVALPSASGIVDSRPISTQETFGQILIELSRNPKVKPYLVTVAPDVATSTNLAGFINRTGIFSPIDHRVWNPDSIFKWIQNPAGQHIELGISEMNLFSLLGQLGLAWDLSDQPLLPVGTVYDPFVCRGLDAFIHAVYSGARFVIAGTPSGITLAPEGGAHQSLITPSIGLELPNTTFVEPSYAVALDWLLCDALARIAAPRDATAADPAEDGAYYFRLSTRPIDQTPFVEAKQRIGDVLLRRFVLAGAYRLVDASELALSGAPVVSLVGSGAVMPEVIAAAAELHDEGVAAHVIDVTSSDRLYSAWQHALRHGVRTASTPSTPGAFRAAFPTERAPLVTVHDAASHAMAWLGSALGVPCVPLGVDQFGQSGSVHELYGLHDLLPGHIVNAALAALTL